MSSDGETFAATFAATLDGAAGSGAGARRPPVARADLVGRYVITGELGTGGMGVVYAAYDPELDRKVAIKLLLPHGRDPASARARLQHEAQAMAKLSHPNVVNVHDVGTIDERVYIAMELVTGRTVRQWLAEAPRSWREIVEVFVQVGRGLAAAHAQGLLHRDVKPDNMMIDETGRARIMDFGVALRHDERPVRAAPIDSEESTSAVDEATRAAAIAGTPRYMAAEQFQRRTIDARTDQFGFCVALWEGLYGERPFDGESVVDLIVAVTEDRRRSPPKGRGVPGFVRRALDRGLALRPEDRWPTMTALLEELSRDPARRRARWAAGGTLAFTATLAIAGWWRGREQLCTGSAEALVDVWDDARRGRVEAAVLGSGLSFAPTAWQRIGPELDAWAGEWTAMHRENCEATRRRGEQSEAVMDLRMACLHRAKLGLAAAANVLGDATPGVVEHAHEVVAGLPSLQRCADVEALRADVPLPDPGESAGVDAIRAELAEAKARREAGDFAAAMAGARRAETGLDALAYEPVRTEVLLELGSAHAALGEFEPAEAVLWEAQRLAARWQQWDAVLAATSALIGVVGYHEGRHAEALALRSLADGLAIRAPEREASVRNNVANVLLAQGRYDEAEREYRAALELRQQTLGDDDPVIAAIRNNIASVLRQRGRYAEAEVEIRAALALRERTLGADHPAVAQSRDNLANVLRSEGRHADAEAEYRAALAIRVRALGPAHIDVVTTRYHLARVLHERGDYAAAETEHRAVLELRERALGPDHPDVAASRNSLASVLLARGKLAEAESEHRTALALREKALGSENVAVAASRNNLANVLRARGKYAEAEVELRAALAARVKALGPEHPNVATSRHNLANVLHDLGRDAEAEAEYRAALAIREQALGTDHPDLASSHQGIADVLRARRRYDEAEAEIRAALALREKLLDADHPHIAVSHHGLAEVLHDRGEYEAAEAEHRAALVLRERVLGPDHPDVAESLAGLGATRLAQGDAAGAVALLERAAAILEHADAPGHRRARTAFALARALWPVRSERARARRLALDARELDRAAGHAETDAQRDIAAWLRTHR